MELMDVNGEDDVNMVAFLAMSTRWRLPINARQAGSVFTLA